MNKEALKKILKVNTNGFLVAKETNTLEFKENFNQNDLSRYAKTMVAMANAEGGYIIFGVSDNPRVPKGMSNNNLDRCDSKNIVTYLNNHFSKTINFDHQVCELNKKKFGYISIKKCDIKPILCIKNDGKILKKSEIYFRYNGESTNIQSSDIEKIIAERITVAVNNVTNNWKNLFTNIITKVNPNNIELISSQIENTDFTCENGCSEADKPKINIDIDSISDKKRYKSNEKDKYVNLFSGKKFTLTELGKELGLLSETGHWMYIYAVVKKYKLQDNETYCLSHNNKQKVYNQHAYQFLKDKNITLNQAKKIAEKQKKSKKKH
jgi:hypothetical protein